MPVGTELDVLVGLGNGYDLSFAGDAPLLLGGGVGVPPLYNLAKRLIAMGKKVTVVLGFNTKEEIFYENEFKALGSEVFVTTADGSYGIKGFVTDKFLAYWANAFNWIIMGGFKTKYNDDTEKSISLETLLIWEISDWLDGLSFFDGDTEFLNLDDYKNTFTSLNSIYKNPDKWTIYYAFTNEEYDNGEPVNSIVVLLINEKKNLYATIYSDGCDFKDYPLEKAHLVDDIEKEEKRLKENNYKRLQVGSN